MKVKAKPGAKCPMEGAPRKYITDQEAIDVPATAYYNRLVRDGSLVIEGKEAAKTKEVKTNGQ